MKKAMDSFQKWMTAITFAEAGEWDMACLPLIPRDSINFRQPLYGITDNGRQADCSHYF